MLPAVTNSQHRKENDSGNVYLYTYRLLVMVLIYMGEINIATFF